MGLNLGPAEAYFDPSCTVQLRGADGGLRTYTLAGVSAALGIWCRAAVSHRPATADTTNEELAEVADEAVDGIGLPPLPDGVQFGDAMVGVDVLAAMAADGVDDFYVRQVYRLAFLRVAFGDDVAEGFWTTGGAPQPAGPANRQERRAVAKAKPSKASSSRTTATAGARTTRSRASGTGTSTPKPSAPKKAAKSSPGRRSSATGS